MEIATLRLAIAIGIPKGPLSHKALKMVVTTIAALVANAFNKASVYFIENATNNPPKAPNNETIKVIQDQCSK